MTESGGAEVPPKSKEQLQADVAAARSRLSANVESLIQQVHPKAVANKAVSDARDLIDTEVGAAKQRLSKVVGSVTGLVGGVSGRTQTDGAASAHDGFFRDEYGWRSDRFALIGGAIAGVVTLVLPVVAIAVAIRKAVRAHKKSAE